MKTGLIEELLKDGVSKEINNIIIYGAGRVAKVTAEKLLSLDIHFLYFAITERKNNPYQILGAPVVCVDELMEYANSSIVIIATLEKTQPSIYDKLVSMGFETIYRMEDSLYYDWIKENHFNQDSYKLNYLHRYIEPYAEIVEELCKNSHMDEEQIQKCVLDAVKNLEQGEVGLARLVVVLGTKCSLRCKDCNNLMPHFKPQKDLNEDLIIHSLDKITKEVNSILKCELIGGEPFLSKNFERVMDYAIGNEVIKSVEVTTNGTILPNEKQISLLKNKKVLVRISDYGVLVDKNKLIQCCENHGIKYMVLEMGDWIAPGGVECRNKSKEELRREYKRCSTGYFCKALYENKIFNCTRAASLYALKYMSEPEFIDVEVCTAAEIKEFLLKDFSEACNYCDLACDKKKIVEPAEQLKA